MVDERTKQFLRNELGEVLEASRELCKELNGTKGAGYHLGGEGPHAMHRWSPGELVNLALKARETRALEEISDSLRQLIRTGSRAFDAATPPASKPSNDSTGAGPVSSSPAPVGASSEPSKG